MDCRIPPTPRGSSVDRRTLLGIGAAGVLSEAATRSVLRAASPDKPRSVLFVFLTGGLSHHDSFDMKPDAPSEVRGEFDPISTRTPGLQICEHLPQLAERSDHYALVRSMTTASDGHEQACHMLLTGRLDLPPGFSLDNVPNAQEWPSIPAVITYVMRDQRTTSMPTAAILPEPSVNEIGKVRPGQYAGRLGDQYDAWHINIAAQCPLGNGACPDCFRFDGSPFEHASRTIFDMPVLALPAGGLMRFDRRIELLRFLQNQQRNLEQSADHFDRNRQQAISVLTDPGITSAFGVEDDDPQTFDRYGRNKFGLSLLMGKRLIEAGVKFVQVNLGKNSSWDTHERNFVNLKENLLPYLDQSLSALLDDLGASGRLDETLVVVTGEFGRTPKINKNAGRDHWGPCNSMLFAGGGVQGGQIIGASDRNGAYPLSDQMQPENFSATIYRALGLPVDAEWTDVDGRPHRIFRGRPIDALYTG
ncbi:MAG: DUF1501 domain-containing protein [Planctomycetaceae bacterium]